MLDNRCVQVWSTYTEGHHPGDLPVPWCSGTSSGAHVVSHCVLVGRSSRLLLHWWLPLPVSPAYTQEHAEERGRLTF